MRRKLENEIVDRAVARAEVLVRQQIGPADQRAMIDDFIGRLGGVALGGIGSAPPASAAGPGEAPR